MEYQIIEHLLLVCFLLFQTIFGVGLLVFGTPTLLILDYTYTSTLSILIPISLIISLCQINFSRIDIKEFKKNFYIYSITPLIFFLILTIYFIDSTEIKIYVAIIMIFTSLISMIKLKSTELRKKILKYKKFTNFFIGSVHGLTNLGGGFVSNYASFFFHGDKLRSRKAIAFCYFVFGSVQIFILIFSKNFILHLEFIYLIFLAPLIFFFTNFFFKKMNFITYTKVLYSIILFYGLSILIM